MAYTKNNLSKEDAKIKRKAAGRYLKECREAAGVTQREVALAIDIAYYTFIAQIEAGTARVPPEYLVKYARCLGIVPAEFAKQLMKHYDPYTYEALFVVKNQS